MKYNKKSRKLYSSNPDIKDERSLSNSLYLSFFLRLLTTYHARFLLFFVLNLEKSHNQGNNGAILQAKDMREIPFADRRTIIAR